MQCLDDVVELDVGLSQDMNDVGGGSSVINGRGKINAQRGTWNVGVCFLENKNREEQITVNLPEIVGTGCRDIDDCTSLDEEVQHKRTPFGDMQPLRGTGSLLAWDSERAMITYNRPRYFGWIHIFRVTRNSHRSTDLSFENHDRCTS